MFAQFLYDVFFFPAHSWVTIFWHSNFAQFLSDIWFSQNFWWKFNFRFIAKWHSIVFNIWVIFDFRSIFKWHSVIRSISKRYSIFSQILIIHVSNSFSSEIQFRSISPFLSDIQFLLIFWMAFRFSLNFQAYNSRSISEWLYFIKV